PGLPPARRDTGRLRREEPRRAEGRRKLEHRPTMPATGRPPPRRIGIPRRESRAAEPRRDGLEGVGRAGAKCAGNRKIELFPGPFVLERTVSRRTRGGGALYLRDPYSPSSYTNQ